jgi:hypothetical protein
MEKLHATIELIRGSGWRSVGEFLVEFFSSDDPTVKRQAASFLTYYEDRNYTPATILSLWKARIPSGASARHLDKVLMVAATSIMSKEVTIACRDTELKLSATELKISHLTPSHGLEKICVTYTRLLPMTWTLLTDILMAENDYERYKHATRIDKDAVAKRVGLFVLY